MILFSCKTPLDLWGFPGGSDNKKDRLCIFFPFIFLLESDKCFLTVNQYLFEKI